MSITQSMELPIIPERDEAHPSVMACRVVLRRQEAEIERLRAALNEVITNGEWTEGEQRGDWRISQAVYETARDAVQQQASVEP